MSTACYLVANEIELLASAQDSEKLGLIVERSWALTRDTLVCAMLKRKELDKDNYSEVGGWGGFYSGVLIW